MKFLMQIIHVGIEKCQKFINILTKISQPIQNLSFPEKVFVLLLIVSFYLLCKRIYPLCQRTIPRVCHFIKNFWKKNRPNNLHKKQCIIGLENLGNTCFMNSALQCLFHIQELTKYFIQGDYITEINKNNPLGTGGDLCEAYADVLKNLDSGQHSPYRPQKFKMAFEKFQTMYEGYEQHDAAEFITYLLDGLHEDLNRVKKKPQLQPKGYDRMGQDQTAKQKWQRFLMWNQSKIVDLIFGQSRSIIKCTYCQIETYQFDPFVTCPLSLQSNRLQQNSKTFRGRSLEIKKCLEFFQQKEDLNRDSNPWFCSKCQEFVSGTKYMQIYKAPKILIFSLRRFKNNSNFEEKDNRLVDFPIENFDLSEFVANKSLPAIKLKQTKATPKANTNAAEKESLQYDLFAISNHYGGLNGGHYTAFCMNPNSKQWYEFNDSRVSKIDDRRNLITKNAYILFYRRKN